MKRATLYRELGDTGLNTSGWGEIGDEFLREWQGAGEKAKRVREMLYNSPVISALRLAIEMPLRDIDWQFVSDDGNDDPRVTLLNDALDAMSHNWDDHLSDALDFLWYGWSMFAITYRQEGGRILWRKFKPLAHDTLQRWHFEADGGLKGIQQWPHLWPEMIPVERMVIYRFRRAHGNPEGESILRPAWTSWYYAKNIQHIEAVGIERNPAGLPVITLPEKANLTDDDDPNSDDNKARRIVINVRNDEHAGLVLPFGWDFSLAASSGAGKVSDTDMIINRYDKRMLMSTLSQFLMLGMDSVGSLATFAGSTDFFTMTLNAVADTVSETFTKFAAARLLELNGFDPAGVRLEHSPAGSVRPEMIADALAKVGAGGFITWTAEDEVWLRSLFRLPKRAAGEIEQDREQGAADRAARADALREAMRQRATNAPADVDEQTADLPADEYDADGDDAWRLKMERQWQKRMSVFLERQGRDVMRQARREHGGNAR